MSRLAAWFRSVFLRRRLEREMKAEVAEHLDRATERLVARGLSPEEARKQALREFGNVTYLQEKSREARGSAWLDRLGPDIKLAFRMLVKHPALTIVGGLGMAVASAFAIGFFTFLVFYYSHPPLEEGERIVTVEYLDLAEGESVNATLFDFGIWRDEVTSVQDLAAFRATVRQEIEGVVGGPVQIIEMTASAFDAARVPPLLGRPVVEEDEAVGSPPVVVIGEREWQVDFAGDPAVIGRTVRLSGIDHTIVGVMPESFRLPWNHGYWTPLQGVQGAATGSLPDESPRVTVFGRLGPGVSRVEADVELEAIAANLRREYPDTYANLQAGVQPYIRYLFDLQAYSSWYAWLVQLLGGLILGVVAVNVAVLVYARTATRRGEIAVRTALGAGRRRIVTQLFLEALALGSGAAVLGLLIASVGWRQMLLLPNVQYWMPYWLRGGLPVETIFYAAALAVLSAFIVGALPALQATGSRIQGTLRGMGGGTGLRMGKTWTLLIVAQVGIVVAGLPALVGAVLGPSTVGTVYTPNFPVEETLAFRLVSGAGNGGGQNAMSEEEAGRAQAELIRRVEEMPGVVGVTFASSPPLSGDIFRVDVEGGPADSEPSTGRIVSYRVAEDYFDVLGVALLAGRALGPADVTGGGPAVVVNRGFADAFFGGANPMGRTVRLSPYGSTAGSTAGATGAGSTGTRHEIVGVVENLYRSGGRASPRVYRPMELDSARTEIIARTGGAVPEDLAARLREVAADVAPGSTLISRTMDAVYQGGNAAERQFLAAFLALVTLTVLLLSAAGISALTSFAVTRQRREIGIRTALGASKSRMIGAIFARSGRQIGIGLAVGLVGVAIVDRLSGGELMGEQAPLLLGGVAALMLVTGLLAAMGPARRALRIQPMEALREE